MGRYLRHGILIENLLFKFSQVARALTKTASTVASVICSILATFSSCLGKKRLWQIFPTSPRLLEQCQHSRSFPSTKLPLSLSKLLLQIAQFFGTLRVTCWLVRLRYIRFLLNDYLYAIIGEKCRKIGFFYYFRTLVVWKSWLSWGLKFNLSCELPPFKSIICYSSICRFDKPDWRRTWF